MKILLAILPLMVTATAFADYNELSKEQSAQIKAQEEADSQARAIKNRDEHNARLRGAAQSFANRHGGAASMSEQIADSDYGYRPGAGGYISRIEFTLRDRQGNDCVASEAFWGFWLNRGAPRVFVSCKYKDANGAVQNGPSTESVGRSVGHVPRRHHRKY